MTPAHSFVNFVLDKDTTDNVVVFMINVTMLPVDQNGVENIDVADLVLELFFRFLLAIVVGLTVHAIVGTKFEQSESTGVCSQYL